MKIVRQQDATDCGICCLLSIIKYYNGFIPLEQLRIDTMATKEGTTALNLILASKKYGFDALGIKCNTLDDIHDLPAIAHMNKNNYYHYVVIYKITNNNVILMDPAYGKVIISKESFLEDWTKVLLVFYPKRKITILKNNNSLLDLFIKVLFDEKKLFFHIILVSFLLMVLTVIGSYYFKVLVDAINLNYYIGYLKLLVIIFLILLIFKIIFKFVRGYLESFLNKNIDTHLHADFVDHLYKLPLNTLISRTSGEIITRYHELNSIKSLWTNLFIGGILDFFLMLGTIPLLLSINKALFLILFLCIICYLIVGILSSKFIYKKAYRNIELEETLNSNLIEDIEMINSIKNLNVTCLRLQNSEKHICNYLKDTFNLSLFLNKEGNIKELVTELGFFLINTWGFYLVYNNDMSITSLVTFNTLLTFILEPIKNCLDSLPKYNYLKASWIKINDFLNIKEEKMGKMEILKDNSITFINVNYAYGNNLIINNFNANITSGSFVLLSGPSGCGKSTLCNILDGYLTDYKGSILFGNLNIKDLSLNTIREHITYVNQNESIITGTIKENILLNREYDIEVFNLVCSICYIEDIVAKKPLRYETTISNITSNISGGEKERIILARSLLKGGKVLILDEALSEVDYDLETKIISNIRKHYPEKTIIYITHKHNIKNYDQKINLRGNNELL